MKTIAHASLCILMLTLACLAMPAQATSVSAENVTQIRLSRDVYAPRRSPTTGAPIHILSASTTVSYADLDLSSAPDMAVLRDRIKNAARSLCHELDRLDPLSSSSTQRHACVKKATRHSFAQFRMGL